LVLRFRSRRESNLISDILTVSVNSFFTSLSRFARLFFLPVAALFIFSCAPGEKQAGETSAYFDFKGYMSNEIALLKSMPRQVRKQLVWDGKEDSLTVSSGSISWERELAMFLDLDINRPAYRGIMLTDSATDGTVTYRIDPAARNAPPVTEASYRKVGEDSYVIGGVIQRTDLMNSTEVRVLYHPGSFYEISGRQTVRFTGISHDYLVRGNFAPGL